MPRQARAKSESGIYHVILRGINKQSIFLDEEDNKKFLYILSDCKEISKFKLFAYCLMKNHIHLLIKEEQEPLELIFKRLGTRFVFWYNQKYDRSGHLFQDRYKSEPVENDAYFLMALRYIIQNPLKAGLCRKVEDYKWTSYNDYFKENGITDTEFALNMITEDITKQAAQLKYFIDETNEDKCLDLTENKKKIADKEIKIEIKKRFKVESKEIKEYPNGKQAEIIRWAKEIEGVTLRQISRITGLTINKIFRI